MTIQQTIDAKALNAEMERAWQTYLARDYTAKSDYKGFVEAFHAASAYHAAELERLQAARDAEIERLKNEIERDIEHQLVLLAWEATEISEGQRRTQNYDREKVERANKMSNLQQTIEAIKALPDAELHWHGPTTLAFRSGVLNGEDLKAFAAEFARLQAERDKFQHALSEITDWMQECKKPDGCPLCEGRAALDSQGE